MGVLTKERAKRVSESTVVMSEANDYAHTIATAMSVASGCIYSTPPYYLLSLFTACLQLLWCSSAVT